ncbi:MAG TPA: NAD-dependent epimerase/dehydratase family protein [Candidatus Deferrimicrobiaceae bacterium]
MYITGVAGFIGSHVAERLLRVGDRVLGLDNFDPFYDRKIKERNLSALAAFPGFRFTEGDIRDPASLSAWGAGEPAGALIHLAARAGVRPSVADPVTYVDVNVRGTVNMLEWARERGVPRIVFASSSSVYGGNGKVPFSEGDSVDHPVSPYAATKKAGELLCHAYCHLYGMSIASLRFFTAYGPRQRPEMAIHKFTRHIFEGREIELYGDGSSRRDYTYIDDVVGGVIGSLGAPPGYRVYNLGESAATSLSDLVSLIEEASGISAKRRFSPPQPGDVPVTFADISLARAEIGYAPSTPIREGIAKFVEWYRATQLNHPEAT